MPDQEHDMTMVKGFRRRRLARLGKIRLGDKVIPANGGREHPKDRLTFAVPEEVAKVYGEDPAELNVMVPSADISQWFPVSLQRWSTGNKLQCKGNGEVAVEYREATNEWVQIECGYKDCPHFGNKACTERGELYLILPEVNIAGVYQVDTGSFYGVNNVHDEFETFAGALLAVTGNPSAVRMVTFRLTREEKEIPFYDERTHKRMTTKKALLHLHAPIINVAQAVALANRLPAVSAVPALGHGGSLMLPAAELDDVIELPEAATMPAPELYPNGAPVGPDLGQKQAWAALIAQVQALGKDTGAVTKSVLSIIGAKDAKEFGDLAGETEAAAALDQLASMCKAWQEQGAPAATGNGEPAPATAKKKAADRNLNI
jgi:hypothetical protein